MGKRSLGAWKHKIIKNFKHRAITFQQRAKTIEEFRAWKKVEEWCDSFLGKQVLNEGGVIIIPEGVPNFENE